MAEMNNSAYPSEEADRLSLDMLETALPTEVPTPSDDSDDEVSGGPYSMGLPEISRVTWQLWSGHSSITWYITMMSGMTS